MNKIRHRHIIKYHKQCEQKMAYAQPRGSHKHDVAQNKTHTKGLQSLQIRKINLHSFVEEGYDDEQEGFWVGGGSLFYFMKRVVVT